MAEVAKADGEGTIYRFEGTFELLKGEPVAGVPQRGFMSATIGMWADGTIYSGSLALEDRSV